jgi:hypothetical protein
VVMRLVSHWQAREIIVNTTTITKLTKMGRIRAGSFVQYFSQT